MAHQTAKQACTDSVYNTLDDQYAYMASGVGRAHDLYLRAIKIGCEVYSLKVQVGKKDG